MSQAPGGRGWGVVGLSDMGRPGRLEWSRGEEDRKRLAGRVQALEGALGERGPWVGFAEGWIWWILYLDCIEDRLWGE